MTGDHFGPATWAVILVSGWMAGGGRPKLMTRALRQKLSASTLVSVDLLGGSVTRRQLARGTQS